MTFKLKVYFDSLNVTLLVSDVSIFGDEMRVDSLV